jgi:protein phosphatase PTC7
VLPHNHGVDHYGVLLCSNAVFGLGVADGVYMWKLQGIDSGLFSQSLMTVAKSAVEGGSTDVLQSEWDQLPGTV